MNKPRIALAIGIICISIFPVLVKLGLTPGLISAFYRMAFAGLILIPFVIWRGTFIMPARKNLFLAIICGILFGADVAVWNIAIQGSTATQASLLTNLSPVWVGIGSLFFLKNKPTTYFWIGTGIAVFGMIMLVGFKFFINLDFDLAFIFGVLSGIFYASYILVSKNVLLEMDVISFLCITLVSSTIFLGILSYIYNEPFYGFSSAGWGVLVIQALVCQLLAWLLINYSIKHMRATRVSVSLLAQAILASVLAWIFLNESITLQMIFGGLILLLGIWVTFYTKKPKIDLPEKIISKVPL